MRISDWSSDVCSSDLNLKVVLDPMMNFPRQAGLSFQTSGELRLVRCDSLGDEAEGLAQLADFLCRRGHFASWPPHFARVLVRYPAAELNQRMGEQTIPPDPPVGGGSGSNQQGKDYRQAPGPIAGPLLNAP